MAGLPYEWQDVFGLAQRRSRSQELSKAIELGAQGTQITCIRDEHLGWMGDRSRRGRSGIAPEIRQLVGANHIEHSNAILVSVATRIRVYPARTFIRGVRAGDGDDVVWMMAARQ